jgi:hypothetical protein
VTDRPLTAKDIMGRAATNAVHFDFQGGSMWSYGVEGIPRLSLDDVSNRKERTRERTWKVDGQPVTDLQAALDVINGVAKLEDVLKGKEPRFKGAHALSIRQPWVYAIFHLGKDIENRDWQDDNHNLEFRGRFLVHASTTKTKEERYAYDHLKMQGHELPPFDALERGGIVGAADLVDIVTDHPSRWALQGQRHLVLGNVKSCPLIPCPGRLGFFKPGAEVMAQLHANKPTETAA